MALEKDEQHRALAAIAAGARQIRVGVGGQARLCRGDGSGVSVATATLDELARRGLIRRRATGLALTGEGEARLRREAADSDPFLAQHREMAEIVLIEPEGRSTAKINLAESPVTMLARRKDRNGRPILDEREAQAGERLRRDYDRGQIMPRIGANWDAAISTGRRAGAAADMSDGAIAARTRVERALDAVGPELSGVLVDICCFLKGLETVEMERGWPVRSAKIVLKTALGALARHYEPPMGRKAGIVRWSASDYRPAMGRGE